ncbi:ABC transporter substrate-binding protein [Bradyrhizobium japonicum]|uniref:ABC transporter substrate-binding protein n=1 Tax=Bradyrhizobium japonicum TaxID=375 RepID=UPI000456CC51|nr:ABC transporter substrate-binding protein [Bradyrhizobium japonicum]AHY53413.1 hypothetical protein BJS_00792 [Bradyrhizobium japonicum SEMIA 5079]MCD9106126.1 ABC transporter substrate-binding protein [Bradyrhizobium japonicum]MCD9252565.1 ABC transporter substrate-binding protein [Bradyrhizobium japonicum SEMIA 5079]MCD9817255.1 ABC transporter substrate-binding protein [Bradyrhizobium japonicum]MCD9890356.1 ABC transporter substrate-binding protein [Bradyrhizobium japonicum]
MSSREGRKPSRQFGYSASSGSRNIGYIRSGKAPDEPFAPTQPVIAIPQHFDPQTKVRSRAPQAATSLQAADKRAWTFKVVPNDDLMASAILKYIAKSGAKTLGFIGVSDGYGEGYYKEVGRLAPTLGLTVTTHEVYARADTSVTGQALKAMSTNPDAVFIASAGTPTVLPQQALRERGYTGKIFQTHGVASEEFIKLGGATVEGAIFAGETFTVAADLPAGDPFRHATEQFVTAYEAVDGQKPNMFAAHLWDVVALIGKAAPNAPETAKPGTPEFRAALRDELERGQNIYLNNGLSSMSKTDHNGYDERSAFLIKVEGGKFRLAK